MAHDIFPFVDVFVVTNILTRNYHEFLHFLILSQYIIQSMIMNYISEKENVEKLVLSLEKNLPLEKIKGLPTNKIKPITEIEGEHTALNTVIRKLENFKGIGKNLIICALNSPYLNVRRGAVNTLEKWKEKGYVFPSELIENIKNLEKIEVDKDLKEKLNKLLK